MSITWRPATWTEIEQGIAIQPKHRGDALVGVEAAMDGWKQLFRDPFFRSAVLESGHVIGGHNLIGFGASVLVSAAFADAEIAAPRPNINSRVIASIQSGRPVLATPKQVARANAG